MNLEADAPAVKPEFEPSQLVEYGDAEKLTRNGNNAQNIPDATYLS